MCVWVSGSVMDGNQEECGTKTCRILADVGMFLFVWFFFGGGLVVEFE